LSSRVPSLSQATNDPSPRNLAFQVGCRIPAQSDKDKLGFECVGTWQNPPVYAIVARDKQAIHFRRAEPPTANPDKIPGRTARRVPVRRRC
jgi:hypothetical protein